MATIANLAVSLTAKIGDFDKGFQKAQRLTSRFASDVLDTTKTVARYGAAMVATGAAVAYLLRRQNDALDTEIKMARALNTTVQSMFNLETAGRRTGVAMDKIQQAARQLSVRLSQASQNSGPLKDTLRQLGLDAETLTRMPLDQKIATINGAIAQFVPVAQQAAISARFFGEEGGIALARLSPEAIAAATAETSKFGRQLTEVDAAKVEIASDAMSRLQEFMQRVSDTITVEMAPLLADVSQRLLDWASNSGDARESVIRTINAMLTGAGYAGKAFTGLRIVLNSVQQGFFYLGLGVNKVMQWINQGVGYVIDNIRANFNWIYQQANKVLPESFQFDLMPERSYFTQAADAWKTGADYFSRQLSENRDEMAGLFESFASPITIQDWAAGAREAGEKLAQQMANGAGRVVDDSVTALASERQTLARQIDPNLVAVGAFGSQVDKGITRQQGTTMVESLREIARNTRSQAIVV